MIFFVSSRDGDIRFRCEADNLDAALLAMAVSQGYSDYQELCIDLGYNGSDFEVSQLRDGRREHPHFDYEAQHRRERGSLVSGAFRFLRRNA